MFSEEKHSDGHLTAVSHRKIVNTEEIAIHVDQLSKRYEIYENPGMRLKQFIAPRLQRILGMNPQQYFDEFWALRNVSFTVRRGETVGIIGQNGSGKSTLLQIICGTLFPTEGVVQTSGRIGALLELGSGFNPEFTGRENIYMNGSILGLKHEEIESRLETIIAFADIGFHIDQPVKVYSSGMYVRLAFAVQACIEPDILIVDEALSVGDEKFQRRCFDHIEGLRSRGCTVFLVTHSTSIIEKFCQRGILMHQGKMHGIGPAKEIVDQYHALLYSDERAYLRFREAEAAKSTGPNQHAATSMLDKPVDATNDEVSINLKALITNATLSSDKGNQKDHFRSGESCTVSFSTTVFQPLGEIQAGVLIRTIEGVSVFGGSTMYHGVNYHNARPGDTLLFRFTIDLNLCAGTYFVTIAIAEAGGHSGMQYLDKKTDVLVLKITKNQTFSTGIAALPYSATTSYSSSQ